MPDIVTLTNGSIVVQFGTRRGTFGPAVVTTGLFPSQAILPTFTLEAGDFNRDGKTDFVIADDQQVFVVFGKGDGTFVPGSTLPVPPTVTDPYGPNQYPNSVTSLAVGDINGDHILDIVTLENGSSPPNVQTFLGVQIGNGDGTFTRTNAIPLDVYFGTFVRLADMNGDGRLDAVVSRDFMDAGGVYDTSALEVFLNTGKDLSSNPLKVTASDASAFVIADLNGDGVPDVAVLEAPPLFSLIPRVVDVFLNDGSGQLAYVGGFGDLFKPQQTGPQQIAVADINRDGIPDLLVTQDSGSVATLLGSGDGKFAIGPTLRSATARNRF